MHEKRAKLDHTEEPRQPMGPSSAVTRKAEESSGSGQEKKANPLLGHVSTADKSQGGSVTVWSTSASRPQECHPRFGALDSALRCAASATTDTIVATSAED